MTDIALTEGADVMPMEGHESSGAGSSISGNLSFLSGTWVNQRLTNVEGKLEQILNTIIDFGLLVDGFGPFSQPITDDMLIRMSPDQFRTFYETLPSLQERSEVLARMTQLKLPSKEELPYEPETRSPTSKPKLAFGFGDQVSLGQS